MRSTGNFYPEWGHAGHGPSFRHTVSIALVAATVGATASSAAILSLIDAPVTKPETPSISARAIISNVGASEATTAGQDRPMAATIVPPTPATTAEPVHDPAVAHVDAAHEQSIRTGRKSGKENRMGRGRTYPTGGDLLTPIGLSARPF